MRQDDPFLSAWKTFALTMTITMAITIPRVLDWDVRASSFALLHSFISISVQLCTSLGVLQACCKFKGENEEGGGAHQEEAGILNREGPCLDNCPDL